LRILESIDTETIRDRARECVRRWLAETLPPVGGEAGRLALQYLACLEERLGRAPTALEEYEFEIAFDAARAVESSEGSVW